MNLASPGTLVISRAGHDKGKAYLVLGESDAGCVLLADGRLKTTAKPKKKKVMHLQITGRRSEELGRRLAGNGAVQDHEIRKAIADLQNSKEE